MHILPLALTLVATYLAIPALSHNCPYPRLAKAYCCKTTAMTIVQPHPEQDLGIHLGEDCEKADDPDNFECANMGPAGRWQPFCGFKEIRLTGEAIQHKEKGPKSEGKHRKSKINIIGYRLMDPSRELQVGDEMEKVLGE